MRDKRVFKLVLLGLFLAIISVLTIPPGIGYGFNIPALEITITIIHIPVIIGGVLLGRKYAYLLGLFFGVTCFMLALNLGIVLFQNPIIAIVPRLIFGFLTFEIYNLLRFKNRTIRIVMTMGLSTLCHTVLVMTTIYFFGREIYQTGPAFFNEILKPVLTLNGLLEILLAIAIGTPLLRKLLKIYEDKYADTN